MIIILLLLCIPVLTVAKLDTVVFQVDVKLLTMSFLTDNKSTIASYVECNTNSCNGCFKVCIRSTSQSQCTVRIHYTTQHTNMVNKQLSFPRASHNEKLNGFRSTVFIPEEELMDAKLLDVPVFRKMTKWEKIDLLRYTLYPKEFIPKSGESTEWENVTLISKKKVLRLNIAFKVTYKLVDLEKYNNKQQKNAATNNTLTTDEVDKTMETNSNNEESVDIQEGDNKQGNNTDISDKLRNDKELIDSIVTNSTNQGNDNNSGSDDQQHKTTDTHNSMTTESEIRNSTIIQPTNQANDSNSDSGDQEHKTTDTHNSMTTESEMRNSTIIQPTNQANDNNSDSDDQQHKTTDTHNAMTTESEMRNSMITQPTNQANDNNSDSDDQQHKTTDTHNAMTTESEMRNSMITQPTNQANDNNSDSDDQQYKTTDTHNAMTAESEMRNTTITQPTNQGDDSIPFWIWFICYLSKTIFRYDICPTMGYRSI
ncbi:hypothetical protein EWB00_000259 [Schistosoma japonicum]|uniref:Uncharacterized protein n=1 Tax=Schistosoma japonicum TaxID=6182 RepID=A0A4Z2DJM1_SCHJA|nr:hypothetical protein EWB00_000259 [Schistosoma japonicum]TNN16597.1 hypothetical protein EWB00_000259 [Schistosoma japonicum]